MSNRVELVPITHKKRKRSLAWDFFEKISDNRVNCLICMHEQNFQGNTGNMLKHLKSKHKINVSPNAALNNDSDESSTIKEKETLNEKKPIPLHNVPINQDQDDVPMIHFMNIDLLCGEEQEDSSINDEEPINVDTSLIRAKIQYFQEKAAFFRAQKYLTFLQTKKLKLELSKYN